MVDPGNAAPKDARVRGGCRELEHPNCTGELRLGAETGVAMADGTLQVFEDELLRQGADIGSARANKVEAGAQCSLS